MTEQEYLTLPDREKDAIVAEKVMQLNVVDRNWPCGHSPDCGTYEARRVFWRDEAPDDAKFTERGPIYLEADSEWPPKRNPREGDMVVTGVEPVPFYSSEIAATWQVLDEALADENAWEFAKGLMDMCGAIDNLGETHINLVLRILNYLTPAHICVAALKAQGAIT